MVLQVDAKTAIGMTGRQDLGKKNHHDLQDRFKRLTGTDTSFCAQGTVRRPTRQTWGRRYSTGRRLTGTWKTYWEFLIEDAVMFFGRNVAQLSQISCDFHQGPIEICARSKFVLTQKNAVSWENMHLTHRKIQLFFLY